MKYRLFILCLLINPAFSLAVTDPLEVPWETIKEQGIREGKCIYLAFLGDGWSVASSRFSRSVLESDSFREFADKELVYCPIRARVQPPLGSKQTARLQSLVIHFDMKAYPTFILMSPGGEEILRHEYKDISAEAYISLLKAILPAKPESHGEP